MQTIRIHSVSFRHLFILYHVSAAIGFLLLLIALCLLAFHIDSHMVLIPSGLLMIVFPLYFAPPEIIIDLKERVIAFRNGMHFSSIKFKNIDTLYIEHDILLIKNDQEDKNLSIHQDHFKHISLYAMKEYIEAIIAGNTHIDAWRFNSVKLGSCLLPGGKRP